MDLFIVRVLKLEQLLLPCLLVLAARPWPPTPEEHFILKTNLTYYYLYEHLAAFVDPHLAMEEVEDCLQ